ncbi:alpha/beta hydrolase [Paenibacillus sediminis]|uniref:Alpha-beta hydrolase superfamily lysophospholipase n=1 Tax=Paenibacillus sediminis TaxID=664909 RepID=A0ABS4H528_9BACL|nr:alpha/beta hydrolase [Paenibacillus sediminis]MBP1937482.1 alpha-beta hydrolase superfamily lysophospholipase [Paenibacillus sediminis]
MRDPQGVDIFVHHWLPEDNNMTVKGIVLISHGMAETAERYTRFASELVRHGYIVYAHDQRGHGQTAGHIHNLGYLGEDGFNWMVRNIIQLKTLITQKHPGLPLFLLGHSMGSFLTQKVMYDSPEGFSGFILSGTNGKQSMLKAAKAIALLQSKLQGVRHPSVLLNTLIFGGYNRAFSPARTAFDWLSRDPDEVDKYIDDPYCGAISSSDFFLNFFRLLEEIHRPANMAKIQKDIPIYVFSGDQDPVGMNGKGVKRLVTVYRELGLQDIECKLYPGGRHEMLNEINRDEVTHDVIAWLNRHLPNYAS